MANKELTAKIKLDSSDAEAKLNRLNKLIKGINKAVTGHANTGKLEQSLMRQVMQAEKTKQATLKTQEAQERVKQAVSKTALAIGKEFVAEEKVNQALARTAAEQEKVKSATIQTQISQQRLALQTERTRAGIDRIRTAQNQCANNTNTINNRTRTWANNQQRVRTAMLQTNSTLGVIGGKLRMLASTYLGIMGAKMSINTSDTITKAQNKLNNLNGGDAALTQNQMDKMYASANKVRMAYKDMLGNASKSMTLAGDAFQGSMDNAIRFQEIMAETYTLGGASAEEMSTSMYQMIQALGAGTLAGDELRSVREGAPLAYKAIEKFAQGVYNSTDSLKDLASQGKITSEMVVAAVMNAGDNIDKQFQKTSMTFEQAWDRIKNAAIKAFEPVSNELNKMLNRAAESGAFDKIEEAFWNVSKAIQIAFKIVEKTIIWIADNWNWLKHVLIGGLILYASYLIITTGIAIAQAVARILAFIAEYGAIMLIVAGVLMLIYVFYLWKTGAITTCEAIAYAVLALGVIIIGVLIAIGVIATAGALLIAIAIVALLVLAILFFEQVCYWAAWGAAWIVNIVLFIVNCIITYVYLYLTFWWNVIALIVNGVMGVANSIVAIVHNCIATVINVAMGLWNSISAICQNIGIAFQNAWNGALSAFWNFIADCVDGLDWLAKPLEAIAELFGKSFDAGSFAGDLRTKANKYQQKEYVSISDAWSSGMNTMAYKNVGDAWSNGWNTMNFASFGDAFNAGMGTLGYVDANQWGSAAGNWGAGIKDSINQWGSQFQNNGSSNKGSWLDNLGKELGLDFSSMAGGFPSAIDPNYDTKGAYNPPGVDDMIKNALGDIADDTGSIADSMELSEDDLKYLRKIAEMEWKKEYTTASIKVDMSNYNTVNDESDLDGIVTKLADKLYEEMNVVANGVYV